MHGDDEAAFETFAIRAMPRLLRTAWLLTGDAGRAEDAVQESPTRKGPVPALPDPLPRPAPRDAGEAPTALLS